MNTFRKTLVAAAASALALTGAVWAQGTGTQAERDRGVPGVDVNVGNNARGAVDVNTNAGNTDTTNRANADRDRGVPGVDVDVGKNARGAIDVDTDTNDANNAGQRAARADRG